MSGKSIDMADSEVRPEHDRKPMLKPLRNAGGSTEEVVSADCQNGVLPPAVCAKSSPPSKSVTIPTILGQHESLLSSNLSLSPSCSSDASTDTVHSRASTSRMSGASSKSNWKKQLASKLRNGVVPNGVPETLAEGAQHKKRCAWVTAGTDPAYVAFHDEEWGVPEHDDKKLFEFLVLSVALAELSWPSILNERHIFREVFADFDPIAVSKLSEKKITAPGSPACSLLSELRLRSIIENARQVCKVIDEFGSFDKYIWSFVNNKPIVSNFRYPCRIPFKTPKADVLSKDLVRRGFRGVGPTVVYSFMQVAGMTNDHLTSCFRFHDCRALSSKLRLQGIKLKPTQIQDF